ncbi:hypothetical protein DFH08DRAFT_120716 [Mycena albidolilacea]|uniref:Uncharacterized protein n=1 Tax=Mycena albidolilacea TaxID=1033008 RepID=A0AAD7E6Q9_9AGAR|nr:hypothetical protein DFH08DRAFT_120716 [Mycena albidolilacea]
MLVPMLRSKYWQSTELSARSRDAVRFQERRPMCAMPHVILLCRKFLGGSDADSAMAPSSSQRAFGARIQMQINAVRYRGYSYLLQNFSHCFRAAHPLRYCVLSAIKRPHARPSPPSCAQGAFTFCFFSVRAFSLVLILAAAAPDDAALPAFLVSHLVFVERLDQRRMRTGYNEVRVGYIECLSTREHIRSRPFYNSCSTGNEIH